MNNTISTTDDLQELTTELLRLYQRQTIKVVVVANDFPVKKLIASIFQQRKFRYYNAIESGEALLAQLESDPSKYLIIYDMDTPKLNGVELFMRIKKRIESKNVTLFLMSAPLPGGAVDKLLGAGVSSVLSKPLTQDFLIQALRSANLPS